MIVVTGASGDFGSAVVERLAGSAEVVAATREPELWCGPPVEVRRLDLDDPATIAPALSGADTVLLNATNYGTPAATRAVQQSAALSAAASAGVRRVVFASWADPGRYPADQIADYTATEILLPPGSTTLRLLYGLPIALARDVRAAIDTGTLRAPAGTARATPAHGPDLAEATAIVLTENNHADRTYELTGPTAVTWTHLAALASSMTGHHIPYVNVSDDDFTSGFSEQTAKAFHTYYRALRKGWTARPTPDLAALLGRTPTSSLEAVRKAAVS